LRETEEPARRLGARRMVRAVMLLQWLALVGGAVAVLPKDGLPAARGAGQSDGGIAANRHHCGSLLVEEAWPPPATRRARRDGSHALARGVRPHCYANTARDPLLRLTARELQAAPGAVDSADLVVHQAIGQPRRAHHRLGEIGDDARCLLRPGDPEPARP